MEAPLVLRDSVLLVPAVTTVLTYVSTFVNTAPNASIRFQLAAVLSISMAKISAAEALRSN